MRSERSKAIQSLSTCGSKSLGPLSFQSHTVVKWKRIFQSRSGRILRHVHTILAYYRLDLALAGLRKTSLGLLAIWDIKASPQAINLSRHLRIFYRSAASYPLEHLPRTRLTPISDEYYMVLTFKNRC